MPIEGCEVQVGQSENADDCDDDEDNAFPGNDEICLDSIDNDCDGDVDEDSAVDATTWYADSDGDGFGEDGTARQACAPGDGWAADAGDCNDDEADINPGADEIIGDGSDQDCDGQELCFEDADEDGVRTEGTRASTDPDCDDPSMGGGYFAVYQPKDGVEVFTGIVAVSAAIMRTPWQQPPLNMPVSYFMLRDPLDDPIRGEKELMDPGWFMREMAQYDGPGPRLPG